MANHQGRGQQTKPPETNPLPEVNWISLVQGPDGWRVALLRTRGQNITAPPEFVGPPEADKAAAEDRFRIAAVEHVIGWGEE
jgi:hypothetical protein